MAMISFLCRDERCRRGQSGLGAVPDPLADFCAFQRGDLRRIVQRHGLELHNLLIDRLRMADDALRRVQPNIVLDDLRRATQVVTRMLLDLLG